MMKLFNKGFASQKKEEKALVVTVPDIKEHLVREYERVNTLKLINDDLQQKLEQAEEIKLKYDAAMVTLDEYSKRLERAEREIASWKASYQRARQDVKSARDEVNSYKIQFNTAAVTKEEIKEEIVEELKSQIILNINNHKGNLSKKVACEIVEKTIL